MYVVTHNILIMEARNEFKHILAHILDLLKFGETKHAGLIVFNSGAIIGILAGYSSIHHIVYKSFVLIGCTAFGASVFLSIASQFPVTSNVFYNKKKIKNPNIYFFGDLAHLDLDQFITSYKQMDVNFIPTKFHTDLINQILVNARITDSKFFLFKLSCYLTAFGAGLIGISTLIKATIHL